MNLVRTNANAHGELSAARGALIVGALGVVFGDIGTSPLSTVQTVFNLSDPHPVAPTTNSVFGGVDPTLGHQTLRFVEQMPLPAALFARGLDSERPHSAPASRSRQSRCSSGLANSGA